MLVFVSFIQGIFLWRADNTTRRAADAAKDIAERQLNLTGLQADILNKQKEIDRLNYFAAYRPHLEIRFIKKLIELSSVPPDEQPTRVEFVVINSGVGEAIVIGSRVSLEWMYVEDIPIPTDLEGEDLVPKRRFLPGATDKTRVESQEDGGLNEYHGDGRKKLYLFGWIVYVDGRGEEFGTTKTTYFGQEFEPKSKHPPDS